MALESNLEEAESDLYPPIRGKYPPGSAEDGTGWEGMSSQEAWTWHRHRKVNERYSVNLGKRLSYLVKKPLKTWKFPVVQWGSGSLNYMGDRTKTHMKRGDDYFSSFNYPDTTTACNVLAPILLDALRLDSKVQRSKLQEKFEADFTYRKSSKYAPPSFDNVKSHLRTKLILNTIISVAQTGLFGNHVHLENCALDENVKVAAQWSRHGVRRHPPFKAPNTDIKDLPNNALFHGEHTVDFQLRTFHPLNEFYDREDPLCRACDYPRSPYKPTALGFRSESMQRPVSAGYRLGAPHQFTHSSVVHTDERRALKAAQDHNEENILHGYALATNFLSTVATAHMQGFNMLSEITYPFCTQTMVTNGQTFIFSAYQLNTLHLWRTDEGNNRQNLFWVSDAHKLYEIGADGEIESINEATLEKILKVLLMPTPERETDYSPLMELKPEIGEMTMSIPHKPPKERVKQDKSVY